MIPKTIHYCWFGGNELPDEVKNYIKSWRKFCPDYEIVEWNESNYDVTKIPYIKQAYEQKKYAFVSDYARLDILYHHGGIYLDTDVELIRSLDDFLEEEAFFGCEFPGKVNTGLGFGAQKENPLVLENMKVYHDKNFIKDGGMDTTTCVEYTTEIFKKYGLRESAEIQDIKGAKVFPPEYFCPYNIETNKLTITDKTYSIHQYSATWKHQSKIGKYVDKKILVPAKIKLRKAVDRVFGEGTYKKIKKKVNNT